MVRLVQTPKIDIYIEKEDVRKHKTVANSDGTSQNLPIFYDGETISGKATINVKRGSKFEHQGIKIDFLGIIEYYGDRASREEYFLRVTVVRRMANVVKDRELLVNTLAYYSEIDTRLKMEVGIEESLHIEFEYDKSRYHMSDVIIGKILFILVRVKIKNMELQIIRKESTGYGVSTFTENETIAKFEIMDGAPVKGESIPIRLFLSQFDLTPTIHDAQRKFSVRYLLNLVLLDEEDRRYYKHQEIMIYRKTIRKRKQYAHIKASDSASNIDTDRKTSSTLAPSETGSETDSVMSGQMFNRVERSMQRYEAAPSADANDEVVNGKTAAPETFAVNREVVNNNQDEPVKNVKTDLPSEGEAQARDVFADE
ncbi:Vacuolar protein sorting-associated protein 26B [Cichlidogyrus casuarinus]|uniref:Vacuolar protein sorting-associated protein 26B n=1 Tax=Cichlidogyrus casuarinus TaxID=1844966 RepID=A0ABD2PWF4_9PLAT